MRLALRSGQPFTDLLDWYPRDVDTAWQVYLDEAEAAQEQAREDRFSQMREELARREGRR